MPILQMKKWHLGPDPKEAERASFGSDLEAERAQREHLRAERGWHFVGTTQRTAWLVQDFSGAWGGTSCHQRTGQGQRFGFILNFWGATAGSKQGSDNITVTALKLVKGGFKEHCVSVLVSLPVSVFFLLLLYTELG